MNKAKKNLNEGKERKKVYGGGLAGSGRMIANIFIGLGVLLATVVIVLVCMEQFQRKWIVKVDDNTVYLDEMTYYLYNEEQSANMYNSIYQQLYGSTYWDYEVEEGVTGADKSKENILATIAQEQILYTEATKVGYAINDTDKKKAQENLKSVLKDLTARQKLKKGLSEEDITAILEKQAMVSRYREDIIKEANIDYDAIKKAVKYEDYKQYDIQYYFVATATTDEEGKTTELSESEKQDKLKKMEAILKSAQSGTAFDSLISEEEKEITFTKDASFTKKDAGSIDEDVEKSAMKMKKDEISDVLKGSEGYYIVKMIDNDSKESYNNEIESKTTEKENKVFGEKYEKLAKSHKVEVNDNEWNKVRLGSYTN